MARLEEFSADQFLQTEVIVIPIIDVSGSMLDDGKINQVNEAMREVPEQLQKINNDSMDGKLLIAPMEFSSGARWFNLSNGKPADVGVFRWIDMQASGVTDLGAAFHLLNEKLTIEEKGGWMKGRGGAAPIIILISDGGPTDNYEGELNELKKRGWFKAANKFAVAVGADADKEVLKKFAGFSEAVIDTEVIRLKLSSIIKKVIVRASQTRSQSVSTSGNIDTRQQVVQENGPEANESDQKLIIEDVVNEVTNTDATLNDEDLFDM